MQKIIVKTALITVSVVLIACVLICGGILLFNSRLSAEFFSNMGNEKKALQYYERGYERDATEENLLLVIHSSIIAEDSAVLIEYFTVFDAKRDGAKNTHEEFLASKYCTALCEKNESDSALITAKKYVGSYSEGCAPRALMAYALNKNDDALLHKVLLLLEEIADENANEFSKASLGLLNSDIKILKQLSV